MIEFYSEHKKRKSFIHQVSDLTAILKYNIKSNFNLSNKILGSYPNLKDLICEEDDEQFADYRWSLFHWLTELDADFISRVRSLEKPKHIKIALFALKVLVKRNFNSFFLHK